VSIKEKGEIYQVVKSRTRSPMKIALNHLGHALIRRKWKNWGRFCEVICRVWWGISCLSYVATTALH